MVGAGGKKMLRLAAQHADIVDIIPPWRGSWSRGIQDQTFDGIKRKINRVKSAAEDFGRDPDDIARAHTQTMIFKKRGDLNGE